MSNVLSASQFTETGATRLVDLGARKVQDTTGRIWHYGKAGGSNLSRGKLAVAATIDAQRINLSFATAPAIGDKRVQVTIGTGNAAEDDFADGWFVVQDGTGEGRAYPIEGHSAITASTAGWFRLKEQIDTAGALAEVNVDLVKNFYDGIVISVPDQADLIAGVPNVAVTASEFAWFQTYGPCAVWFDEAVTNGAMLTIGTGTSGAVEMLDAAGEPMVGHVAGTAGVDTEYQLVDLQIRA